MNRKEIREKAERQLVRHHIDVTDKNIEVIESFGIEIVKSVAKDMEEILRGQRGDHPSTIRWMLIEEIREYAKRLEEEK